MLAYARHKLTEEVAKDITNVTTITTDKQAKAKEASEF